MKRLYLALLILALLTLACSLDTSALQGQDRPAVTTGPQTGTPHPSPTPLPFPTKPNLPITCTVSAAEALNLRDAPGMDGNVIAWLVSGEILTLSSDPPVGVWVKVTTAGNVTGWVNSNFCEVTE